MFSMARRCVPLRARSGMAVPVWDVPVRFHSFGALSAAGAAGRTLPGDEEEVAAVSPLDCSDSPERNGRWERERDRIVISEI